MKNLVFLMCSLVLSGCVHYMPAAVSSTSIGTKNEVPVQTAIGTSSAYYVFGLGPTGDDSLIAAIDDAKSQAKSDSIANVFVDRKITCVPACFFPIYKRIDTMVYGTLVKYRNDSGTDLVDQRDTALTSANISEVFAKLSKGARVMILFGRDKARHKYGEDGDYLFDGVDSDGCAVFKPINSWWGGGKYYCPNEIEAIRVPKSVMDK